jgi:hypothetical protein
MSACVPDVSVRLLGFVRVFSLSLCCMPTVMYIRTARFPLSGSLGGFEGSSGQSTLFSSFNTLVLSARQYITRRGEKISATVIEH